jgi:YjbE family integral membrane protein
VHPVAFHLLDSCPVHSLSAIFQIIFINLVLSGDNAVVIGMAAHRLPSQQRRKAILFGGCAAIVLRILLTAVAFFLLGIPGLSLVAGALLVWIAFKLLAEEQECHDGVKAATGMKEAIVTILVADLIMSVDNVIGVAAAAGGNIVLLIFGLVLSMGILMVLGSLVAELINKFWWLAYVGSAVIAWTGAGLVFRDPILAARIPLSSTVEQGIAGAITIGTLVFAHWFHRVRK